VFEVVCRATCGCLVFNPPNHPFFFDWCQMFFSTTLHTRLGLSHPLILGVSRYICNQPWILWKFIFFIAFMVGKRWLCMILCEMLLRPLQEMWISYFMKINKSCHSAPCSTIFTLLSWHCAISWWCLHIGRCCHCQFHSSWFDFTI